MEHQRRDFVSYLQGSGLNTILNRYIRNLKEEMLERTAINNDWTVIPDLYTFVTTKVFRSEVEALTFANTIPAAAWMILHLLLDDGITERVRGELFKTDLNGSGFISGSLPGGGSQYPVDTFWPERFLQYPNEPLSGPTRKEYASHQMPAGRVPPRSVRDDRGAKLVTKETQGHWFPFGGGAIFVLHNFDVQLCAPDEARKVDSHHRVLPFGSHAFDRPVPIRIRRRVLL
ncbi:hypothetical protein CEP54_015089 [Fusarium duplospermum]|uniref:Uncharacterized protein n=1 Tax=Fusarium duplospermum TaxID=1325734 RepID=A0A428NRJ3_9HYPO|nr:hypothetical protein CEP54_015089 [Fusarium duplospermum]